MRADEVVYMKLALAKNNKVIRHYKVRRKQGLITLFLNDGTKITKNYAYIIKYL